MIKFQPRVLTKSLNTRRFSSRYPSFVVKTCGFFCVFGQLIFFIALTSTAIHGIILYIDVLNVLQTNIRAKFAKAYDAKL